MDPNLDNHLHCMHSQEQKPHPHKGMPKVLTFAFFIYWITIVHYIIPRSLFYHDVKQTSLRKFSLWGSGPATYCVLCCV